MAPLACTCWSRRWHTHPFMERDSPILSHPQIVSLAYSGLLPTFTCFSLTDHTACPVDQEKYGECNKHTCFLLECVSSVQISFSYQSLTNSTEQEIFCCCCSTPLTWIPCHCLLHYKDWLLTAVLRLSHSLRWSQLPWFELPHGEARVARRGGWAASGQRSISHRGP